MAFHFTNVACSQTPTTCFEIESILTGSGSSPQRICCCLISDSSVNEYITNLSGSFSLFR